MQTVLIIDDEFGIVEALSALLADEGYRTHSAPDGQQGLAKLNEVQPDVILLDFMMPVLDGPGVLEGLRVHPVGQRVPVILMSAVAEKTVRARCGDSFAAFLHKPFNVDDLLPLLRRLLQHKSATSAAPARAIHVAAPLAKLRRAGAKKAKAKAQAKSKRG
jgi:CheY-like chemotaxis protein